MELTVANEEAGMALWDFLKKRLPAAPPAYLGGLVRKGRALRAQTGLPLVRDASLLPGDRVALPDSQRLLEFLRLSIPPDVDILFETREILAVNKPPGLASHRGKGHEADNLQGRVAALTRERGHGYMVAPVHRLDADTSGPVLFGKGKQSVAALGALFAAHAMEKIYLGLAAASGGMPGETGGILSTPVFSKGKERDARALVRALSRGGGFALLEIRLETGRTHQIRQQLARAETPLAGDIRYKGPALPGLGRLFLHCRRIAFDDPWTGGRVEIGAPLPGELREVLGFLGMEGPL
jgi:23S rRNA-/tRNA-specific pseudouridylate synthase